MSEPIYQRHVLEPYSREYNNYRLKVGKQAKDNTELQIEYERILDRVRQTKASVIRMGHRHFTAPVEEIEGTVDSVSPGGISLKEFPGRRFQFSSVGMSAADMTARMIGEHNKMTRADAAREVDRRRGELRQYLADNLSGESVRLVIPKGASENAENIRAVVMAGGTNINQVSPSCPTTKTSRTRGREPARIFPSPELPGAGSLRSVVRLVLVLAADPLLLLPGSALAAWQDG